MPLSPALRVPNYHEADLQDQHASQISSEDYVSCGETREKYLVNLVELNARHLIALCQAKHLPSASSERQTRIETHVRLSKKPGIPHLMAVWQCYAMLIRRMIMKRGDLMYPVVRQTHLSRVLNVLHPGTK